MKLIKFPIAIALLLFISCSATKSTPGLALYSKKAIKSSMERVFKWQLQHPVLGNAKNGDDWARAVFYSGIMRAYASTKQKEYYNAAFKWSDSLKFQLANRLRHADDHTRGQTYLALYQIKKDPSMLAPTKKVYDSLMLSPKPGREEWWWCDALFMSPPVLVRLAEITKDQKYNAFLNQMWWDTTDFLFDKEENLYYRDKSFFPRRTATGKKVFWSRGNGWVLGGLVQVLEHLPKNDPAYQKYVDLYLKMTNKVATLQQEDGLWRPNLGDPAEYTSKETSGSGFFVFALAWGINNGYLARETYLPIVKKGWKGLNEAVTSEGKLTWVQKIGAKPEGVKSDDNQEYGSGAFLMAGTEMLKLNL